MRLTGRAVTLTTLTQHTHCGGLKKLAACLIAVAALLGAVSASAQTFAEPGFSVETVATFQPYTPVGVAFAPDGRAFVYQKGGAVRVVKNGVLLPTPFISIAARVNRAGDRGLLGFALDPNFATNGYAYLLYVYEPGTDPNDAGPKTARLTRVKADPNNPDVALANSEQVILGQIGVAPCSQYPEGSDCMASDSTAHTIGTVRFAPDGKMFVGMGDGASYADADQLALRAQNLNYYNGKILRINPDGTAPADNPFYDPGSPNSVRSKVYAYGLRNPYRFSVHPQTGEVYIGDVGWGAWEEVNRGRGANFGWPCYEGPNPQPRYQTAFPQQCGALPQSAVTKPLYAYDHAQGVSVTGGPIYDGTQFPAQYRGNYFFADYGGAWIRRMILDASGNVSDVRTFATDVTAPVTLEVGPDGALYFITFTTGQLRRIRYGALPTAAAAASIPNPAAPYTVAFSSAGSSDPNGSALSYAWEFGDGATSTAANPTHTYSAAGVATFTAKLTVTNAQGLSASTTVSVTVGSRPPTAAITQPADGARFTFGTTVTFQGAASDPDETLPANALSWTVLLHHDEHVHAIASTTGAGGSFVAEDHGSTGTYYYEIVLTATDSAGLADTKRVNVYPVPPPSALPAPWAAGDVGDAAIAGGASYANGTFTVKGSGSDVGGFGDGFQFVYRQVTGDVDVTARVTGIGNTAKGAKAGVMIRESLAGDAAYALMSQSAEKGNNFERRLATGWGTALTSGGYTSAPHWVRLVRKGSSFTAYRSADGVQWAQLGSATINMGATVYVGLAVTSNNNAALTTATLDNVAVAGVAPPPLPSPWAGQDVGDAGVAGGATHDNGTFTVRAAGSDIAGFGDGFHFVSQRVGGDVEIVARVTGVGGTAAGAKAGVMIRESLAGNAAHALMSQSYNEGAAFERRLAAGWGTTLSSGGYTSAPHWVRLVRRGNTVVGYKSADGALWTLVGTATINLPGEVYVGLAVTSSNNAALTTATLDNVRVTPLGSPVPAPWAAGDVGDAALAGGASYSGGVFTVRGSGSDIGGFGDGFHFVHQQVTGDVELTARVAGVQGAAAGAKAGVMVRESLAGDAACALMSLSVGEGLAFERRLATGWGTTLTSGGPATAPYWVRLVRRGGSLTAYRSADGVQWTQVGAATINLAATVYAGLAVTGNNNAALATAGFDNVTVTPLAAAETAPTPKPRKR
jgi:glucose/arabinose dehydrogenase/regulation of enolase protein 1 (concanavalin A-like superfamily)